MNSSDKAASTRVPECPMHGCNIPEHQAASVPMTAMDENGRLLDPLTVAIAHAFEVHDLDDIEAQDGDMLRGLARLAGATVHENYQRFIEWMDRDDAD